MDGRYSAFSLLDDPSEGLAVLITWKVTQCAGKFAFTMEQAQLQFFNSIIFPKCSLVTASIASCFDYMCPHADAHIRTHMWTRRSVYTNAQILFRAVAAF